MLFNSYVFICLFLPLTVVLFHLLRRRGLERGSILLLTLASLTFYGWWSAQYLLLLIPLMLIDFVIASRMVRLRRQKRNGIKLLLILGDCINLGALGYYKYANFFRR